MQRWLRSVERKAWLRSRIVIVWVYPSRLWIAWMGIQKCSRLSSDCKSILNRRASTIDISKDSMSCDCILRFSQLGFCILGILRYRCEQPNRWIGRQEHPYNFVKDAKAASKESKIHNRIHILREVSLQILWRKIHNLVMDTILCSGPYWLLCSLKISSTSIHLIIDSSSDFILCVFDRASKVSARYFSDLSWVDFRCEVSLYAIVAKDMVTRG